MLQHQRGTETHVRTNLIKKISLRSAIGLDNCLFEFCFEGMVRHVFDFVINIIPDFDPIISEGSFIGFSMDDFHSKGI